MKFHDQTKTGMEGNCFAACLASLLDVPLETIPDFYLPSGEDGWWDEVRKFLATHDLGIFTIGFSQDFLEKHDGYFIVAGHTDRGLMHATLWHNGKMIHDPHPSKAGLTEPTDIDIIYKTFCGKGGV